MAKILGVGGVFFKSADPANLASWYARWLGLDLSGEGSFVSFSPTSMPQNGATVWSPFDSATDYFAPSTKDFMFNFVVDNLDEALAQVKAGGAQIVGDIQQYDYGRFGWFLDPDGNKGELWEPKG